MRLPRPLLAVLTVVAVLLTLGSASYAATERAKPVQPKTGVWEGAPKGVSSYYPAGWTLSKVGGRLHMTAHPVFGGIYAPNSEKCEAKFNPALSKSDYRLGTKGRFRITDHEPNQTLKGKALVQHVIWKGTFTSKRKVSGTVSIWLTKAPPAAHSGVQGRVKPAVVCRDMHHKWSGSLS